MDERSPNIEARIAEIEQVVHALERRLAAIEERAASGPQAAVNSPETSDAPAPAPPISFDPVAALSIVGRTLVLLGGAYLLRAITEAGILPVPAGVALGFAYASIWLIAAHRAARAPRFWSAVGYGATTSIIALPLLFEAMVRFAIIGGEAGTVVLTVTALAVLAIAVRDRLQPLAWIIVCGTTAASVAISAATGFVLPLAIADIALGIVTLWIGYTVDWIWLRWLPALVANLAVLALASGVSNQATPSPPWAVVATQLLLFAGYFASIAVRTLVREREMNVFEALQGTAALAVGFGGAAYVTQATGSGAGLLVGIGLACAAGAYAAAFAFVARHQGLHRNYYFYTSLALVLVLTSTAAWQATGAIGWAALAVLTSWMAARTGHVTLSFHSAVYFLGAAIGSGLFAVTAAEMVGAPAAAALSPVLLGVFAAGCACWAAPPAAGQLDALLRLPRLSIALLLAGSCAAAMVGIAVTMSTDPGVVATARTAALASVALAAASVGRLPRFTETGWLVYPLLVAGGLKLAVEDLPRSRPATLFIALAVYGIALIAAPRIARVRYVAGEPSVTPPAGCV
jgi:hypothetical protein